MGEMTYVRALIQVLNVLLQLCRDLNVSKHAVYFEGGYGFCHVPAAPGMFNIECPTWLPQVRYAHCNFLSLCDEACISMRYKRFGMFTMFLEIRATSVNACQRTLLEEAQNLARRLLSA